MPSSQISSSYNTSAADEMRLQNYRNQIEQQHDMEVRDLLTHNEQETQHLIEDHVSQMGNLRNAYNIQISEEAEALEEKLHQTRATNEDRVNAEKKVGEQELEKLKSANQLKIQEYRKNADMQIETLRKQLMSTSEFLHAQAKRNTKKEREASGS